MSGFRHRIRQQVLEVETDSEQAALALQPRLETLNRRRWLPLIERLLDEVSEPGRRLRLDRLAIDLGTLPADDFDRQSERRLERELRRVLRREVRRAEREPRPGRRPLQPEAYRRELLEHFLLRGTVPFWGPPAGDFSLEALVTEIVDHGAGDLVRTVRRLGRRADVLERIVYQLSEPSLQRLIRLLEPEHAALILAYLGDLRQVHRAQRLVPLSDPQFAQILWVLTQMYLVLDPGSQFNRLSFVRSLLRGLAVGRSLDYRQLLETLRLALERTRRQHPLSSSLPAVVTRLVRELDRAAPQAGPGREPAVPAAAEPEPASEPRGAAEPPDLEALLATLASGDADWAAGPPGLEALLATFDSGEAGLAAERVRWLASRPAPGPAVVTRRLLRAVPPATLLASLAPGHRQWIPELVRVAASAGGAGRLSADAAWEAVLSVLVRRGASGWSAEELLHRILEQLAARAAVDDVVLLGELEGRMPALSAASTPAARTLTRALGQVRKRTATRPLRAAAAAAGERLLQTLGRYQLADSLRYYLCYGMLPWADALRSPERTPERILAGLARLPRTLLRSLFTSTAPEEARRRQRRLAVLLSEEALGELLLRLLPAAAAAGSPLRSALAEFSAKAADRRRFLAAAVTTVLFGHPLDLEELAAGSAAEARESRLPGDPGRWRAEELLAALVSRLRFGAPGTAAEAPSGAEGAAARFWREAPAAVREMPLAQLLEALVEAHPDDAAELLRGLRERPDLWTALMRSLPASLVDRLLVRLAPGEESALGALRDALAGTPIPHRPGSRERIAAVMLGEVLRAGPGERLTPSLFAGVLRQLFGPRIPPAASRHLGREAGEWRASSRLPAADRETYAAAFEAAVATASAPSAERGAAAGEERPPAEPPAGAAGWAARRDAVFAFLLGEPAADVPGLAALSRPALEHALRQLAERSPEELRVFLHRHLSSRRLQERWAAELSESTLAALAAVLEPRRSAALLDTVELLASAALEAASPGAPEIAGRAVVWRLVLEFLYRNAGADRLVDRWVGAFFAHAAARLAEAGAEVEETGTGLLETAERVAQRAGHARLRAILQRSRPRLLASFHPQERREAGPAERKPERPAPPRPSTRPDRKAFRLGGEDGSEDGGEPIYIDNAGLVLCAPFLPHFFGGLDLLERDDEGEMRMRGPESASRAVHLLQILIDGRATAPEPLLVLNKLLCGMATAAPVAKGIDPSDEEREACDKLLRSMLANWEALSGTSVAGLQETFLQRQGRLRSADDGWRLRVQRKTVDVLVDQIPWSVSVILHNWMPGPIYVDW